MVNAVILAGGRGKDYKNHNYYERKYGRIIPGEKKAVLPYNGKPLVSYVIDALRNSKNIEDIIVVGNIALLMENGVNGIECIEQENTILKNAIKGYNFFDKKGATLFLPCDIPKISSETLDEFIDNCDGDFCSGITSKKHLKEHEGKFHRPYFWMIRNGERRGYRASNLIFADPECIKNNGFIEFGFNIRKFRNPLNIASLYKLVGRELFIKYFKKELTSQDVEIKVSELMGCIFRFVDVNDAFSSLDVDFASDYENLD